MPKILLVCQDKGGVGKSLTVRALAEAVPNAPIIEIDSAQRLIEIEGRTTFFPMRAERIDIDESGGRAARREFDGVINAIGKAKLPTIIDVGANTGRSLLSVLTDLVEDLKDSGTVIGLLVVVTAEPGALAEAPRLMKLAKPFAQRFILENRLRGPVPAKELKAFCDGATISSLDEHIMEDEAVKLLQDGGLALIPNLDPKKLNELHGLATGARIRRDLMRLRSDAIEAVREPAGWLVGDA